MVMGCGLWVEWSCGGDVGYGLWVRWGYGGDKICGFLVVLGDAMVTTWGLWVGWAAGFGGSWWA